MKSYRLNIIRHLISSLTLGVTIGPFLVIYYLLEAPEVQKIEKREKFVLQWKQPLQTNDNKN